MKKLTRRYETLESLNLFSSLGDMSKSGDLQDPQQVEEFLARVKEGLSKAIASASTLHGRRVQEMFQALVASLGKVRLIKVEDQGEGY